jgi:hypothetical protein
MPSRVSEFASCISSRSLFIDHRPVFGLRAILAFHPTCLLPKPCWLFGEFQRSYPRTKSSDFPKGVVTVLSRWQFTSGR